MQIFPHGLKDWLCTQEIYIVDDTIKNNIAFGVDTDSIDNERIIELSKLVNLHKFVKNELPENYNTVMGEKGITISGGQKQRLGIAKDYIIIRYYFR